MHLIAQILIAIVALEHLYFLYFEMFAWETIGKKTFKQLPATIFAPTKTMAANQGLYNGFLAAGLIWSLCINSPEWQVNVAYFFLGCVMVAGIYGGITVSKKILFLQGGPAFLAFLFLWFR